MRTLKNTEEYTNQLINGRLWIIYIFGLQSFLFLIFPAGFKIIDRLNQSQRFMTIFRSFKNQSMFYNHIWYHVSRMSIKQLEILLERSALKEHTLVSESNIKHF